MKSFGIKTLVVSCLFAAAQAVVAGPALAGPSLCNGAPNGIIDGDEQCETGPCCTAKCELKSADTVCRAKADSQCDVAETCGDQAPAVEAACPADALVPDGTSCNDGQFCTVEDVCSAGACAGAANPCDDANDCTADSCTENNDKCHHDSVDDGTACEDGSACTSGDTCGGGVCHSGEKKTCDDENLCTTDSCNDDTGECVFTNNTKFCDDGDYCTVDDVCADGTCGGAARDCADSDPCTIDSCDEDADECTHGGAPDGTSCEDGDYCTVDEVCTAGICDGAKRSCDDGNDCTDDSCHEASRSCKHLSLFNGEPCSDGLFCTHHDKCQAGQCQSGEVRTCDDGNLCTDDVCDEDADACANPNNSAPCDDGNFCTTGDTCGGGSCSVFSPTCDDGNVCTTDSCDEAADSCGHENTSGGACEDGQFCTVGDTCSEGVCAAGTARDCNDSNACTDDACDEAADACDNEPNTDPCDDGQFCTVGDACIGGTCAGTARDCADSDICTDDVCDESADACTHPNNTAPCDDGAFCTVGDACSNGACTGGSQRDCGDANDCTTDACNEATDACEYTNNTLACDDGQFCTVLDSCSGGVCTGGLPNPCDDGNACTTDSCDESGNSCVNAPNTSACNDGDPCTENDVCAAGTCSGSEIPDCTATTTTLPTTTTTLPCPVCGDFNGDCEITASDALAVLQAAVGIHPCELSVCDFSGDGKITALDALAVLRAAVGLPNDPMCPAEAGGTTTTTTVQ